MTTTETPLDLNAADEVLYMASREVASIPYTAPEVLSARMRLIVPLGQDLVAEVRSLRALRVTVRHQRDATTDLPAALLPAEKIALTVAVAQVRRGEQPTPNVTAVCIEALARLAGVPV